MREFYRPQDRQAALAQIDLNPIVTQVIELTRVRWRDLPQQRGIAIAMRTELQQPLADYPRAGKRYSRRLDQPHLQCGRRDAGRRHVDGADSQLERDGAAGSRRFRCRHGRGNATALPGALLHDQGRARHWPRPRHGLRHGSTTQRGAGDRQRAASGHDHADHVPGSAERNSDCAASRRARGRRPASALYPHRRRRSARARIPACHARERRSQGHRRRRRTSGHRRFRRSTRAAASTST